MSTLSTLSDLLAWLKAAPSGTQIAASTLAELLESVAPEQPSGEPDLTVVEPGDSWSWAERIWTVPAERRLGVREACEALGKGRSWVFERMRAERGAQRLPHRKLDGEVVFTAGEVRSWIRAQEEAIHGGPMESTPEEKRSHLRAS